LRDRPASEKPSVDKFLRDRGRVAGKTVRR